MAIAVCGCMFHLNLIVVWYISGLYVAEFSGSNLNGNSRV